MKQLLSHYLSLKQLLLFIGAGAMFLFSLGWIVAQAFVGPTTGSGVGSGGVGVNAANSVSVGTSTPRSDTKLFVVGSSTASTDYALQVVQSTGGPLFLIRNDGKVGLGSIPNNNDALHVNGNTTVNGTVTATNLSGVFSGSVAAGNIMPGVFATSSGNFAFRSSLGVATSTTTGLPAELSVYGGGYFRDSLVIGTPSLGAFTKRLGAYSSGNTPTTTVTTAYFYADDTGASTVTSSVAAMVGTAVSYTTGGGGTHTAAGLWGNGLAANDAASQFAVGVLGETLTYNNDTGAAFYARSYTVDGATPPNDLPSNGGTQMGLLIEMNDTDVTNYGIYQASNNPNYFAGRIGIGIQLTGATSTSLLHVKSAANTSAYVGIDTTTAASGTTAIIFLDAGTTKWNVANSPGVGNIFFINTPATTTIPFAINQNADVGIGTAAPTAGSGLHVAAGKYAQFEHQTSGAPPSVDCDSSTERGRINLDITNNRLYVCNGSSTRWGYMQLN